MRTPDKTGLGARAYEIVGDRSAPDYRPDWDASIGLYLVNGSFHPMWSWWAIAVVHLRDLPGVRPASKQYPEAEYEFGIYSLDTPPAGKPFDIDKDALEWARRVLSPPDVIQQFDVGTALPVEERDRIARKVLDLAIDAVVDAHASPDSDFRRWWRAAIPRTVEHVLTGGQHETGRSA